MHLVKKINYIDGYKISLTFNDKKTKVVDIEPYLNKGVFLPLKDSTYFNLVKVKYDTIVWPNEADFCPDVLYKIGKEEKTNTIKTSHKRSKVSSAKTRARLETNNES
jgi:hypothetical protein